MSISWEKHWTWGRSRAARPTPMPRTPSVQPFNWEGRLRSPVQAATCGAPSKGQSHQQENTKSWGSASLQLRSYAEQARPQSSGWDSPGHPGSWGNRSAPDKLSTDSPGWPEILHMLRQLQSGLAPPTRSSMTEPTPICTTKMQGGFRWKNKPGQTQHLPENCKCSPAHTRIQRQRESSTDSRSTSGQSLAEHKTTSHWVDP